MWTLKKSEPGLLIAETYHIYPAKAFAYKHFEIKLRLSLESMNFSTAIIRQLYSFSFNFFKCFMKHLFAFIAYLFCLMILLFRLNLRIKARTIVQNCLIFQGNTAIYIRFISKFFSFIVYHLRMNETSIGLCTRNFKIYLMNSRIFCLN